MQEQSKSVTPAPTSTFGRLLSIRNRVSQNSLQTLSPRTPAIRIRQREHSMAAKAQVSVVTAAWSLYNSIASEKELILSSLNPRDEAAILAS